MGAQNVSTQGSCGRLETHKVSCFHQARREEKRVLWKREHASGRMCTCGQGAGHGSAWMECHLWVVRGKAPKVRKEWVMKTLVRHGKEFGFCQRLIWVTLGA